MTSARDPHDDLLPPPSSSEPYEVFLARVGRATSHSSGISTQPAAAALPSASVTTVTTGILFPTPFHTYKVSSWMHHPNYKPLGLGCRYQRRSTRLFLSLGVARTGLRRNHFSCQCLPAHYAVGCLRRTSRTYRTLPQEALHLFLLFQTLKNALSYTPALSWIFFECHAPFSSSQPGTPYYRPPQDLPLWLPRWRNQMLWILHRALSRTWSKTGKRSSCGTWKLAGISCWWRSTSANCGSRCSIREHGPRLAAAAESLCRPRGVKGSA